MPETPKRKWTLWSIAVVVLAFPLVPLFTHFGRPASGPPAYLFTLMLLLSIRGRWELSRKIWFWVTIAGIVAIHVPLILLVPWSSRWIPAIIKLPFCIVDLLLILGIISTVEKLNDPAATSSSESE